MYNIDYFRNNVIVRRHHLSSSKIANLARDVTNDNDLPAPQNNTQSHSVYPANSAVRVSEISKRKAMQCPDVPHRGADPDNAPCSGGRRPLRTPIEGGDQ